MDTFKVVQSKEIEEREALKQMQQFLKREEQFKMRESTSSDVDTNRIDDNVIQQIKTVQDALTQAQSR